MAPMLFITGIDANGRTFIVLGALLSAETIETFEWVFEAALKILGKEACLAVHVIVTDADFAETGALLRQVLCLTRT